MGMIGKQYVWTEKSCGIPLKSFKKVRVGGKKLGKVKYATFFMPKYIVNILLVMDYFIFLSIDTALGRVWLWLQV